MKRLCAGGSGGLLSRWIGCGLALGLLVLAGCARPQPYRPTGPTATTGSSAESSASFLRIENGMHTARISGIAVDAKERYLVTASWDKTARVWDLATGNLLQTMRPPLGNGLQGALPAVAIAPGGETVALGGEATPDEPSDAFRSLRSFDVYFFDRETGRLRQRIGGFPEPVVHLAYSRDGRYLAAALEGKGGIRVYRTNDLAEVFRGTDYEEATYWVEFDRQGRLLSTSRDGTLHLYGADFQTIAKRPAPGGGVPYSARFSPDGVQIAVGFADRATVSVLSGADLSFRYAPDTRGIDNGHLGVVAWSADGRRLHAGGAYHGKDGRMFLVTWSEAGRGPHTAWPVATNSITGAEASANGRLAVSAQDPVLQVLGSDGGTIWAHAAAQPDFRIDPARWLVSADGGTVLFSFVTQTVRGMWEERPALLDTRRQRFVVPFAETLSEKLSPPRTSAPGLELADWRNTDKPRLNGRPLPLSPYETSRSLAVTPEGGHFLLGTEWHLHLIDSQGQFSWPAPVSVNTAWAVNISGDGRLGVAGLGDGTIRWYRMTDGRELLAFFAHADGKRWVLWTPEGFFDAKGGGEELIGYHINRGPDREGAFVKVKQLYDRFYRPDLVAQALTDEGRQELQIPGIGDVRQVLADDGLAPELELVSSRREGLNLLLEYRIRERGGGIGRIVYRINDAVQEARPFAVTTPGSTQPIRVSLPLTPGRESKVQVSAYNGRNTVESRPLTVTQTVDVGAIERPSLYVLAAGVSHYQQPGLDLKYAAADAQAMADVLAERGARLFRAVHVKSLKDRQATLKGIRDAFAEFAPKVKENDVFLLYLAGHGAVLHGAYHFIPQDAMYRSEDVIRQASLSEQGFVDLLKTIRAQKSLVILDTCYAGGAIKLASLDSGFGVRGDLSEMTAITKLNRATGRAILMASSDKAMAFEGYEGHGFFTYALLEGLKGKANTNDNDEISTLELANFVSEQVPTLTGNRQIPIHESQGSPFPIGLTP